MTDAEAREILKRVEIAKPIKFEDYADMKEALDMAIKALEQQQDKVIHNHPCEDCYYNDGDVHAECVVCDIPLEQQPCEDCVSRDEVIEALRTWIQYGHFPNGDYVPLDYLSNPEEYVAFVRFEDAETCINEMPSVTPKFTDEEIQKMQELEQAQLEKAYELGMQISFEEWLSSFNTDSAPQCFNAVQQLKEKLNGQMD